MKRSSLHVSVWESLCGSLRTHMYICMREIVCLRLPAAACTLTDNFEDTWCPRRYLLLGRTLCISLRDEHEREARYVVSRQRRHICPQTPITAAVRGGFIRR